jgi:hypothetical protein
VSLDNKIINPRREKTRKFVSRTSNRRVENARIRGFGHTHLRLWIEN